MKSSYCVCGDLARWAIDPEVPVGLRESDSTYVLRLGVNVQVDLLFCPTCGGKAKSADSPECECSTLARWAAFPASCLMYDQKLNEYHLAYSANGRIILYFCPACGRRLSESKRGDFFLETSSEEIAEFKQRLKDVNTIEEAIAILGVPDRQSGRLKMRAKDKRIYDFRTVIRSIEFTRLSKTLDIVVQELEDGKLVIAYFGKSKR